VNGFSIGPDGKIVSRYDNGQSRITGQVAIVPFL
jgi:flagellar hook protein FlgE